MTRGGSGTRQEGKERDRYWSRHYRQTHPEQVKDYNRQYYLNHKVSILAKKAGQRDMQTDEERLALNEKKRVWAYAKRRNDPNFRLSINLRTRLWKYLRGIRRSGLAIRDLGCSLEKFRAHLEAQFVSGMSWDNYGVWEIDHITPLSLFDLFNDAQRKQACHYTNLQPMWAKDNRRKATSLEHSPHILSSLVSPLQYG